jgi:hypothetical protein
MFPVPCSQGAVAELFPPFKSPAVPLSSQTTVLNLDAVYLAFLQRFDTLSLNA